MPVTEDSRKRKAKTYSKVLAPPTKDPSNWDLIEQRLLIAYYYVHVLGAPSPSNWLGKDETIGQIQKGLGISNGNYRKVKEVVNQTYECVNSNDAYVGKSTRKGDGNPTLVMPGSQEEQIIAKYKEEGCSFTTVTEYAND